MSERLYQKISLDIPVANPGGRTLNFPLDKMDLSWADSLRFQLNFATIGVDSADTFNCYIQERRDDGIWDDRVAFTQVLGNATDAEVLVAILQKFGTLDSSEEMFEPQGSAGGSRLTAGTVKNGPFAGKYYESGVWTYNWRLQCVLVDADNDAFLTGTLYVYGDEAI